MTSQNLQVLMKALGTLGGLLLIGMFLRAKIPLFRKLLIPASVIGGFVGLFLGPEILGDMAILRVPEEWRATWSYMPGVLIVPIFASIPLGMFKDKTKKKDAKKSVHKSARVAMVAGVHAIQSNSQIAVGILAAMFLAKLVPQWDLYPCFGLELSLGFNGGHGTAGAFGGVLMEGGKSYWEIFQAISTTFATIGLLGGITTGIFYINRASKQGKTVYLKDAAKLPDEINTGIVKDIEKQDSVGRETTANSNIECLTVHMGLIFLGTALAYLLRGFFVEYDIPGFKEIPVWPYALIIMYIINFIIDSMNLQWMIDKKVKGHLSGMLADFAICAAIASMPIKAVMTYIVPIIIISLVGFVWVYFTTIKLYEKLLPDSCPFERAIFCYGMATGVMMTGLALLKICDPDFKTPTLEDYSVSNIVISLIDLVGMSIMFWILLNGTSMQMLIYAIVYTGVYVLMTVVGKVVYEKTKEEEELTQVID